MMKSSGETAQDAREMRIFLADGRTEVRSAMRLLLEQHPGVTVVGETAKVKDLVDQVGQACPDLVLLDWELAGQKSSELVQTLHHQCPQRAVVAVSSHPEARQKALSAGADAFVSKVDAPEKLMSAVIDNCCRKLLKTNW